MLLWFAGMSVAIVWYVFRDPAFDYRLVMVGALAPDLVGRYVHSVVVAALVFAVVLVLGRRRWVALPIGVFLHLLLDGMWTRPGVFWWPLPAGPSSWDGLPSFDRPVWMVAAMELAGAVALAWHMRRRSAAAC